MGQLKFSPKPVAAYRSVFHFGTRSRYEEATKYTKKVFTALLPGGGVFRNSIVCLAYLFFIYDF